MSVDADATAAVPFRVTPAVTVKVDPDVIAATRSIVASVAPTAVTVDAEVIATVRSIFALGTDISAQETITRDFVRIAPTAVMDEAEVIVAVRSMVLAGTDARTAMDEAEVIVALPDFVIFRPTTAVEAEVIVAVRSTEATA